MTDQMSTAVTLAALAIVVAAVGFTLRPWMFSGGRETAMTWHESARKFRNAADNLSRAASTWRSIGEEHLACAQEDAMEANEAAAQSCDKAAAGYEKSPAKIFGSGIVFAVAAALMTASAILFLA